MSSRWDSAADRAAHFRQGQPAVAEVGWTVRYLKPYPTRKPKRRKKASIRALIPTRPWIGTWMRRLRKRQRSLLAKPANEHRLKLSTRGSGLYRAANGSIQMGPITWGNPFSNGGVGSVEPALSDIDPLTIVASIHSHSSGSHLPSDGTDQAPGDIQYLDWLAGITQNPNVRMYIVAQNQGPVGHVPYNQINFYNKATAASNRSTFTKGPEVNPDAEPCPS